MHVLILGAGKIGSAIAGVIKAHTSTIEFWDVAPGKVPDQKPITELASWADIVFLCVPSFALRDAVAKLEKRCKPKTIFIALTKGLEVGTGKTIDEMLADMLPAGQPFGLLIGPMLAAEIEKRQSTAGIFATKHKSDFDVVQSLFKGTCIHLWYESQVRSIALASVLKNIYAVGFGICQAMGVGHNGQGWYAAIGMTEMREIIKRLGGDGEIAHGLAGIGDLVATGMSPHSFNRTTGEKIITTGVCGKSEGCNALPMIWGKLGAQAKDFALLKTLYAIVVEGEDARITMQAFFDSQ